jgi:SAM-dependent methyltransferase
MPFAKAADFRNPQSLSRRLRHKRSAFFEQLIAPLVKPLRILDVGGTEDYWQALGFGDRDDIWVTLLNVTAGSTSTPQFLSIAGDARDLSQFKRREFDVVFSNSVIEHVGDLDDQKRMAAEVQRVGKRYFVQTPNRYFPIEPHFLFPWFQFLPEAVQIWLLGRYRLGSYDIVTDRDYARELVREIRLLSLSEFCDLFPVANIYRERLLGMTKSFVAYGGWETI